MARKGEVYLVAILLEPLHEKPGARNRPFHPEACMIAFLARSRSRKAETMGGSSSQAPSVSARRRLARSLASRKADQES